MQVKVGSRLRSAVCATEFIVVTAPGRDVDLRCGGKSVVAKDDPAPVAGPPNPAAAGGTALGKRYANAGGDLELLVTKAGDGTLTEGDEPLALKDPKQLPSSD